MDKKAWIAVTLSVLGLVWWNFYVAAHPPPRPAVVAAPAAAPVPILEPVRREAVGDAKAPDAPAPTVAVEERFETLNLPGMTVRFTNLGGGIADVTLLGKQHRVTPGGDLIRLNANGHIPIGALSDPARPAERAREPYEMRRDGDSAVTFERTTPEGLRVLKRFSVQPTPKERDFPTLNLDLTVSNPGANPAHVGDYLLHAGSTAPIHRADAPDFTEFLWWHGGKLGEHTARAFDASSKFFIFPGDPARAAIEEPVDRLGWVAVKNQFYTTVVTPLTPDNQEAAARLLWSRRFELPPESPSPGAGGVASPAATGPSVFGLDAAAGLPGFDLPPNGSRTDRFSIYAGPTLHSRLAGLGRDQDEILKYGWFKPVSIFLLGTMNWLYRHVGSYAVSILLLTLLIKTVTFYPQWKAMESGRRMAALGPKIKEVRDRYPDDPAKAQAESWKLNKEYGVNPLGGCLPALIQMPIFFGFFRMLTNAAELRNAGFLWVHDLTQPDTVARFLGYPLNILPLLYAGTMFWQLSLTPKPTDPQAQQQQKTMMFIPLVFVFFFYNFAAALSLYYTAQNLLTIIQLYATRHRPLPVLQRVDPTKRAAAGRGGSRGGGFSRLLEQLQQAKANAADARGGERPSPPASNGRQPGGGSGSTNGNGTRARRPRS